MIVFRFHLYSPTLIKLRKSVFRSLHARACGKGGGDSREDGDYDVEDFTPESVVVESSHFV